MELRRAQKGDLEKAKEMYARVVRDMDEHGLQIWDEVYPCEFLASDIDAGRLYLLCEHGEIAGAGALCSQLEGENSIHWRERNAKAAYIDRLAVAVGFRKKGVGTALLAQASQLARSVGARYLRLLVVDKNAPALALYTKNGFTRAEGEYKLDTGERLLLEYGYETAL